MRFSTIVPKKNVKIETRGDGVVND